MQLVKIMVIATASVLTACGGGGGDSPQAAAPVVSTASLPLKSAYKAIVANGLTKTFTISGTCSGSGRLSSAPATPSTFEGVAGFAMVSTVTLSYTNCTPASTAATSTSYFDSNYNPLGSSSDGTNYAVYAAPAVIPTTVTVGATDRIGTQNIYTNSTKTKNDGYSIGSYVVEADTESTAIVNLITRTYTTSGALSYTEQAKYRITATGGLTPVLTDIQYANGSTNHLVFTY